MFQINLKILSKMARLEAFSAARLWLYVLNRFNNHLHKSDFSIIRKELNISDKVIRKNLRRLISLGICYEHSEGYFRFSSWKETLNEKSKQTLISLDELRNLSYLRTLYYASLYKRAHNLAEYNLRKVRDQIPTSSFLDTSASFVKSATKTARTLQTLLNQLKKAEDLDMIDVIRSEKLLCRSKDIVYLMSLKQQSKIPCFIKLHPKIGFGLYTKTSNRTRIYI